MNIRQTLKKIYAYKFLDDLVLMYPFYSVFMASKGLSMLQISSLLILWSIVDLVTNIPTGVLADKYSRKKLLALGQLFKAASFIPWLVYPNYMGFALGFILWGIGGALADGTFEALVYDELRAVERENEYVKVTGKAYTFSLIGNVAATTLAGIAILLGFGFILMASIVVTVMSALVILTLPETKRFEQVTGQRYFQMMKTGVSETVHSRNILAIVTLAGFIGAVYGSLEEYVPLFIRETDLSLSFVAWGVAATVGAAATGSFVAYKYEKLPTRTFMLLLALAGLMMLGAGMTGTSWSVLFLVGYTFLIRMLKQIYDGKLQHSISSGLRATITSVSGFVLEFLAVLTYLAYGLIADHTSNFTAFAVFGLITTLVALLYMVTAPRLLSRRSLQHVASH